MNIFFKVFLLFVGVCSIALHAQFTVKGTVFDFHDKTNLKGATIQLGSYAAMSDEGGNFVFQNVKEGNYSLVVKHPDCENFNENVAVTKNIELTINMEHHVHDVETVTLHGPQLKKGSLIISSLHKEDLDRVSTDNLGTILSSISGVTSLKTGNSIAKPVIHGLYGSRISVINNGVKMAEQEWGVEHAPNVDAKFFDHIDVVKGASALKYGNDGIGGVVVLEPGILPKKDTLFGSVALAAISNGRGGDVSVDLAKAWKNQWFVKAGGGFKKLGDLYIPHHTLQNTGSEISSFNFSVGKRSFLEGIEFSYSGIQQTFGIFKGAHLSSPEDFYQAINFGQPYFLDDFSYKINAPKQEVSHHLAKFSTYKRFENLGKLAFQYSYQLNHRKEYDIRRGENANLPSMDMELTTHAAALNHSIEREKWQMESGVSWSFQKNYPDPATKARRLIPDYYKHDLGVYSVLKYTIQPKMILEAGARYDFSRYDAYKYYDASTWESLYANQFSAFFMSEHESRILAHPILDFHNFSANLGWSYNASKLFNSKLNLSRTDRTPNPAELFADGLHHSAAVMEVGNLATTKETVYQASLSLKSNLDILKGLSLQVNPYLMYSENFINQIPSGVKSTNRGVFPVWEFQQIKARLLGVDADLQVKVSNTIKWNSSFSYLRGDDLQNDEPLILMMPTKFRNVLEYNLGGKSAFYFQIENESTLKQKRYPMRNVMVDFVHAGHIHSEEVDYSSTPAAYSIFHFSTGLTVFKNLNLNFRLNNVLNKEYREYLNRLRYFMPEAGRNFVLTAKYNF